MPITVKTIKGNTTIAWTNEDQTTAASWTIKKEATEGEAWEILTKATVFIGKQLGQMPENLPGSNTKKAASATPAGTADTPHPLTLPPSGRSYDDRPSDGGPPTGAMGKEFWEGMPTAAVPSHLAQPTAGGWEMMPPEEAGDGW